MKEAGFLMLVPMVILASACIAFGLYNKLPIKYLIQPVVGEGETAHAFYSMPSNVLLVLVTLVVLTLAALSHLFHARSKGGALKAADYLHYAPVLGDIYKKAERGRLDPYNIGLSYVRAFSYVGWTFDRFIDWIYNDLAVKVTFFFTSAIRRAHTGNYSLYIVWSLIAAG